jgi:hypothetical protein
MRIVPAALRLTTIESSRLSPNTVNWPAVGRKVALIAMVLILLKVCVPQALLSRAADDRLEGNLEKPVIFAGEGLLFCCLCRCDRPVIVS